MTHEDPSRRAETSATIKAPVSGVVIELKIHTTGGVIKAGEPLGGSQRTTPHVAQLPPSIGQIQPPRRTWLISRVGCLARKTGRDRRMPQAQPGRRGKSGAGGVVGMSKQPFAQVSEQFLAAARAGDGFG